MPLRMEASNQSEKLNIIFLAMTSKMELGMMLSTWSNCAALIFMSLGCCIYRPRSYQLMVDLCAHRPTGASAWMGLKPIIPRRKCDISLNLLHIYIYLKRTIFYYFNNLSIEAWIMSIWPLLVQSHARWSGSIESEQQQNIFHPGHTVDISSQHSAGSLVEVWSDVL